MATTMNDSKITYDDSVIISDTTEFYNSANGYYRKCEVMPYPENVNVVPEPSQVLCFGLAGLFMVILIVLKRRYKNV
jgi:hypothetical protein